MQYLKQSTAATVLVGPVLDADGAAVTSAVIGDFRLAKNGTVTTMSGNTINHNHNGCYQITLTTANTDTLDRLSISVGNTSYSMTVFRYTVLESGMFDALITNGRILRSTNSNSSVLVTGSNHAAADVHAFQTDAIDAAAIAASAVTEIQNGLATTGDVSAVEAKVDTLLGRITSTLFSGITYMSRWLGAIAGKTADTTTRAEINATPAGVTFNETTDSGEAIRDRGDTAWITGSSGAGSGARTVTITVNDGATALQNARVRLTNGAETYTGLTNVSGVVVFNVDDADWIVSITKAGYSYSGTTLTVNGTETATYSMTLISLTASDVDKVTGYWTLLDEEGNEASGIVVTIKARQASRGSAGALHDAATRTATSAANGLVQFTNMIPGWRYSVVANDEYVADFTVPADAVTSVELGSIVARLT